MYGQVTKIEQSFHTALTCLPCSDLTERPTLVYHDSLHSRLMQILPILLRISFFCPRAASRLPRLVVTRPQAPLVCGSFCLVRDLTGWCTVSCSLSPPAIILVIRLG